MRVLAKLGLLSLVLLALPLVLYIVLRAIPAPWVPNWAQFGRETPTRRLAWTEAEAILRTADIAVVMTAHSGKVWIQTRWGFTYETEQPQHFGGVSRILVKERGLSPTKDFYWITE